MKKDLSNLGIELKQSGKLIAAPFDYEGVLTITITKRRNDKVELRFGGMNEAMEMLDYHEGTLSFDEMITITCKEVGAIQPPTKRGPFTCERPAPTDEEELERYLQLKAELEKEGLI